MLELVNVIHHCLSNFHCNYPFGVGKSFRLESSSNYIQFWMAMMKVCSCSIWWSRHISNVDQPTHWCAHIVAILMQCCNRAVRVWVDLTKLNDQVTKELLMTWPRNFSNKVIPISVVVVISGQLTCMFLKRPLIYLWRSDEMKNLWSLAEQPVKPAHVMVAMTSSGFLIICSLKNFMEIKPKKIDKGCCLALKIFFQQLDTISFVLCKLIQWLCNFHWCKASQLGFSNAS